MPRIDMSNELFHWTKGQTDEDAFEVLYRIVSERRLLGGQKMRRGQHTSISFTEAPIDCFQSTPSNYGRFGIGVSKPWLFEIGGRPVIYQPSHDYDLLHPTIQWRHVTYDLREGATVDYAWLREWRIPTEELFLDDDEFFVLVPHQKWADEINRRHDAAEYEWAHSIEVKTGDWIDPGPFWYRTYVYSAD